MTVDPARLPTLAPYLSAKLSDPATEWDERARIENLLLEERSPEAGVRLYADHLAGSLVEDADGWNDRHNGFTSEEVFLDASDARTPWTFRPENDQNRLHRIDKRIYLVRVEPAAWPCGLSGVTFEELRTHVEGLKGSSPTSARGFLEGFVARWNPERDKRPLFATTELEIEDILADTSAAWAERLRDRLGLGHYSPSAGTRPVEILVMRYTVDEVLAANGAQSFPAIPTLLDGKLNEFFFPSPYPGPNADDNPYLGHTLNLSPVTHENDYQLGVELLNSRIDYRPEHIHRLGVIANPVSMPLERARRFHLPWVRLYRDRDDFGTDIVSLAP